MDQQENKLNEDIFFCEDCKHRIKEEDGCHRCRLTGKKLKFYDRSCEEFRPLFGCEERDWDPELKAFVWR